MNENLIAKKLIGRPYWQAPIVASRIDARNCVANNLAAIKALESACGIKVSPQTISLRKLVLSAEIIRNHVRYLYHEVLPNFLDIGSELDLARLHPEISQDATNLNQFSNQVISTVSGRTYYPITSVVGGFKSYPSKAALKSLAEDSGLFLHSADRTLRLFTSLKFEPQKIKNDFTALHQNKEYSFYDGDIWTSGGEVITEDDFVRFIKKSAKKKLFGPIARYNLNRSHLNTITLNLIKDLDTKKQLNNISEDVIAKAIEIHHCVIESKQLINNLGTTLTKEHIIPPEKFGFGISAIESAAGTIVHTYKLNPDEIISNCEIFVQ